MNAGDVMTVGAAAVAPGDSIAEAARIMLEHRISGMPVVDADGALVGIVTERDLLRRVEIGTEHKRPRWLEMWVSSGELAEEYVRARGRKVEDVMTRKVISVDAETPLSQVVALMEHGGPKRLPVLRDGKVAGIVSRANLVRALARRLDDKRPSPGDDLAIRRHILGEINAQGWNPRVSVDIGVQDGVVELFGAVTDERIRHAVEVAARNAPGVSEVKNELRVIPYTPAWV